MKYLKEYRSDGLVKSWLEKIQALVTRDWSIMEICGGQTHSLVRYGILDMLPESVRMIHGPGCPVCVTPTSLIDQAIELSMKPGVTLCSFGDMLRVPGSGRSLLDAQAEGGGVKVVYSPMEAVNMARENPSHQYIFFGVGFETTAPAVSLSVLQAWKLDLKNYSILTSHVLVPPAMEAILSDPTCKVDAFLAAGHVCTIMGMAEYEPICAKYACPIVITGFEPLDLVQGIYMAVRQLENGLHLLENQYSRVVSPDGNKKAVQMMGEVFEAADREWRGIGEIPSSGLELKEIFSVFDAKKKFDLRASVLANENVECIAGDIMKGNLTPHDCPHFGKGCTPEHPIGAPMVSTEGICSAYYLYDKDKQHV